MLLTQLPADVLDRLLVYLPDLRDLWVTVRTSRNVYEVFTTRKASIIHSVAQNMIVREPIQALDLCPRSTGYRQAYKVASHAVTATALEKIYGLRYKTKFWPSGRLSSLESQRFRIALYRLWRLCTIAKENVTQFPTRSEQDLLNDTINKAKDYLDACSLQELSDLEAMHIFLREMVSWVVSASNCEDLLIYSPGSGFAGTYVLMGPEMLLASFSHNSWGSYLRYADYNNFEHNGPLQAWFSQVMSGIRARKHMYQGSPIAAEILLDEGRDPNHRCARCHSSKLYLWGRCNWPLLRGQLSPKRLCGMLQGNLPRNASEAYELATYMTRKDELRDKMPKFDWAEFMEGLLDLEPGDGWNKDEWYCTLCIHNLFRSRLLKWWIHEREKQNLPKRRECPYGWSCSYQHREEHAYTHTHLNDPARNDVWTRLGQK